MSFEIPRPEYKNFAFFVEKAGTSFLINLIYNHSFEYVDESLLSYNPKEMFEETIYNLTSLLAVEPATVRKQIIQVAKRELDSAIGRKMLAEYETSLEEYVGRLQMEM